MEYNNNQMTNNQQLQMAIKGVRKAVQGEREDELFYDYLISEAPTSEEKEIIASIRDDERRHNRMFRRIYQDFVGMEVPMSDEEETLEIPKSYLEGIKKALFGELGAVERYRIIRRALPEGIYRDALFDIITDEIKHASKYNYLFTLNSTRNNLSMDENLMRQDTTNTTNSTTNGITNNIASTTKTTGTNTIDFTPDDWVRYITPLVNRALAESKEGINPEHLYQEFILSGVLVGLGKKPQEAIEQVETWEKTGTSKLLAISKMSRYFNELDYM
jgi:rubrerythrin